ncbi:hypothetical protein OTK49_01150 [Vibrio coralliirubri]|uniref:hypothetical protein n=1 Tax=Vibrio coralliirubri TaxID=1516159 RepID=UPI002284CA10|nr:hypothetical protein [Vibrio coralliirubri]MCY9861136.1 hypothetical protein [Vibrio coralliirubri]
MVGFVGLLSGALAAVFLVFIVMLMSFLQAQLAPTEGVYKLHTESGLIFPVESHILTEEIFEQMIESFHLEYGEVPIYVSTSCFVGGMLDAITAKRYATYNYIFVQERSIQDKDKYSIAEIDSLPILKHNVNLSNACFVAMKTQEHHEDLIDSRDDIDIEDYKKTL